MLFSNFYLNLKKKINNKLKKNIKKIIIFSLYLIASPILFFIYIIIRIISPLVFIRFGIIRSDAIGHFVFNTSYNLKKNKKKNNYFDLFFLSSFPVANKYYLSIIKKKMKVFQFIKIYYYFEKFINLKSKHLVDKELEYHGSRDLKGIFFNKENTHKFTVKENNMGYNFLKEKKINKSDRFICLNIRDNAYKKYYQNKNLTINFSYHDYRDSSLPNYIETIKFLIKKNYKIIRMGKKVNEKFPIENPNFIDYPFIKEKSDFLDIWLMANCFFTITTATGLDEVCTVFDKPMVIVNHLPYGDCRTGSNKRIELFKKLYDEKNEKFLSLKDQIKINLIHELNGHNYEKKNIKIIDNSSEEILEAVKEMEEMVANNKFEHEYNDIHQKKFWNRLEEWKDFRKYHGFIRPKISSKFLKENYKWLLN